MAGLVPAIPIDLAPCRPKRDRRDKPGDDKCYLPFFNAMSPAM